MASTFFVAWDGSESAEKALEYATLLARAYDGIIHLWQAFQPPRLRSMMMSKDMRDVYDHWLQDKHDEIARALERKAQTLRDQGFQVRTSVHVGDILEGLIETAQKSSAQFILMGKGRDKNRVGSLVLKVLRATRRPVIVVPMEFEIKPPQRVLVPIDLTVKDSKSTDVAIDLAQKFNLKIDVLHVIEIYIYESPDAIKDILDKIVHEELEQWKELNLRSAENLSIETHVRKAVNATSGILEFIETQGSDLVIMDSHTRGPLMHLLLGSVAEDVVRRSTVPVILTKPDV